MLCNRRMKQSIVSVNEDVATHRLRWPNMLKAGLRTMLCHYKFMMRIQSKRWIEILPLVAIFWWFGCAGNGQGLDENGDPVGNGGLPVAFEPTFSNIQQNVFSAICIECHSGVAAPEGLRLDAQNSYSHLVNVPSQEQSDLFRVEPGNPNRSYIIRKLEGGPNITGGQMPLDRTPLDQQTINAIRVWIVLGALQN